MKKVKLIRLPVVYSAGGDLKKKWFIEFYVRNPRTGRLERQRKSKGINKFHTLAEREKAAQKMKVYWTDKLRSGWSPFTDKSIIYDDNLEYQTFIKNYRITKSHNGTFRFFASKYINEIKNNVEASTVSTYRSKLRMFDAWLENEELNSVDISAINQPVLVRFFTFIIEERKLSRVSVRNYRQLLTNVFRVVKKERSQFTNPCYDLPETKRINDHKPQPIHQLDILAFADEIRKADEQLWLAISFEYYCFLRPGKELRLLKIGDIDFGRGVIRIKAINSKTIERHVTIPRVFLLELRSYYMLHQLPRDYYVISKNGAPGPVPLGKNNLRFRFNKFRKKLNMPEMYKFYSWKHTGNVRAVDSGISPRVLQGQNGHLSIQTTEIYLKNNGSIVEVEALDSFPNIYK